MSEGAPIVFVVEDDASVRTSIARLVRTLGFRVQTFGSASEFLAASRPDAPACLVLDVRLPGQSGLDLQAELARSGVEIPIIFMTGHGDIPMTVQAMKAGAVEFLTKPFGHDALLDAVRSAMERDRVAHAERREGAALRGRYEQLTPREREVMALIVAGQLNKQVAFDLATSERTVKFHRANLMQKMAAESLADLVRMAAQLGVSGKG